MIKTLKSSLKKILSQKIKNYIEFYLSIKNTNQEYKGKSLKETFTEVYRTNCWGGKDGEICSGSGSLIKYAPKYRQLIQELVEKYKIKNVVDLGCGDFAIGKEILIDNVKYIGVDIVEDVIKRNAKEFSNDLTEFRCLNIVEDPLPEGELCLIRQVLQHLSNSQIRTVLKKCKQYRFVLITEHYPVTKELIPNLDISHGGGTRIGLKSAIVLDKKPFSLKNSQLVLEIPLEEDWDTIVKGETIKTFLVSNDANQNFMH